MKKLSILFSLLFIAVVSTSINAQDQNQKDRETLIKAARFLEEKPLDEKAKAVRGWAVSFVIKTDQVSVVVCGGDFMKPLLDKKTRMELNLSRSIRLEWLRSSLNIPIVKMTKMLPNLPE